MFDMRLELSFACCNTVFHESMFENIILFESLKYETALSAKLLTSLAYVLVIDSGDDDKLVTNPSKVLLYDFHAD